MNLTVQLAGMAVAIRFQGKTREVFPFYRHIYQKFLVGSDGADSRLDVCFMAPAFPAEKDLPAPPFISPIPRDPMSRLCGELLGRSGEKDIGPTVIGARLFSGILLSAPEMRSGWIFLSCDDPKPFRSLYHLLWVFFAQVLGEIGACFMHAAGLGWKDRAYLFAGGSGAGKSTVAGLCRDSRVLSDESPIIGRGAAGSTVFPSPIHQYSPEKGPGLETAPAGVPLNGIYFLVRDTHTRLETMPPEAAVSMIISRHIHHFALLSVASKRNLFDLFFEICHRNSVNYLHFCRDADIGKILSHAPAEG